MEEFQKMHSADGALILQHLERTRELEADIIRMRGEINQHLQKEQSYERQISRLKASLGDHS